MDWAIFWTIFGASIAIVGIIYQFLRNFKSDIKSTLESHERKFELLDNRIFQVAMGKSLKEIMEEEKKQ